jgi:hypothetical protein
VRLGGDGSSQVLDGGGQLAAALLRHAQQLLNGRILRREPLGFMQVRKGVVHAAVANRQDRAVGPGRRLLRNSFNRRGQRLLGLL